MVARTPKLILLLVLQVPFLQLAAGLGVPKRDSQYVMNQNGITWDSSCSDPNPQNVQETKRAAVQRAWVGALELISVTWTRFNTKTWPTVRQEKLSLAAQQRINQQDPGSVVVLDLHISPIQCWWLTIGLDRYVQLFALESSTAGTTQIRSILQNLASQLNSNPGTNGRIAGTPVTISCLDSFVYDEEEFCDTDWATTRSFPNEASSTINFCPLFFELPRFDKMKNRSPDEIRAEYHDEDYDGTDALTIMHEATHLWWIGPTNYGFDEEYGLVECAELAWNCGSPISDSPHVIMNADTYGWYGEYGYFVQKGVNNLWPPSQPQPVQLPLQNY
ncbi:hypothetical protein N7495_004277 [Penicillium taxi]|uniref:uncharacterized protein n=1 Tax=Penicillium taxi TaxID=168475 RepID=UPI0025450679|nr:uncharacterized protein N7495_004277 [Penicillium taxi]KAJ5899533.1 hypothetical protein N7495_004277 [Penicillium taxi]